MFSFGDHRVNIIPESIIKSEKDRNPFCKLRTPYSSMNPADALEIENAIDIMSISIEKTLPLTSSSTHI